MLTLDKGVVFLSKSEKKNLNWLNNSNCFKCLSVVRPQCFSFTLDGRKHCGAE